MHLPVSPSGATGDNKFRPFYFLPTLSIQGRWFMEDGQTLQAQVRLRQEDSRRAFLYPVDFFLEGQCCSSSSNNTQNCFATHKDVQMIIPFEVGGYFFLRVGPTRRIK